ncbi:MAG TPA: carboxypeptidase-like regulatory domain-containing protein [Candidatus Angelobacter sp.]
MPVRLSMAPEAVVAGRVETRDGEPVERALVRVMAASFNMGRVQYSQIGQAATDEDGNFRIANLNARRCCLTRGLNAKISRSRDSPLSIIIRSAWP